MKKLIFPILILALATLACGLDVSLPEPIQKTGETVTDTIKVAEPDGDADVRLSLGGGELTIDSGADGALIDGTVTYNVEDFKPDIFEEGGNIRVEQGSLELDGIPTFDENVKNEWDLKLSDTPMTLRIQAGAYRGDYDFGNLSLKNLYIEDGASDVKLDFSEPNQTEMALFDYQTGASNVELSNLSNANFATMTFQSGAGNYTLDFSGELQQDATVKVESGLANVKIIVPDEIPVSITVEGALTNVSTSGSWTKTGDTYGHNGEGPKLFITVEVGAGNLELTTDD